MQFITQKKLYLLFIVIAHINLHAMDKPATRIPFLSEYIKTEKQKLDRKYDRYNCNRLLYSLSSVYTSPFAILACADAFFNPKEWFTGANKWGHISTLTICTVPFFYSCYKARTTAKKFELNLKKIDQFQSYSTQITDLRGVFKENNLSGALVLKR